MLPLLFNALENVMEFGNMLGGIFLGGEVGPPGSAPQQITKTQPSTGGPTAYGPTGTRQWTPSTHVTASQTRTMFRSAAGTGAARSFGGVITTQGSVADVKPGPGGTPPSPSGGTQQAADPGSQKRKERSGFFRT